MMHYLLAVQGADDGLRCNEDGGYPTKGGIQTNPSCLVHFNGTNLYYLYFLTYYVVQSLATAF
jgi:hypothetical protein